MFTGLKGSVLIFDKLQLFETYADWRDTSFPIYLYLGHVVEDRQYFYVLVIEFYINHSDLDLTNHLLLNIHVNSPGMFMLLPMELRKGFFR